MKSFRPGLRTEILLSLTVLLVAAMILTGFVVLRVTERDLMQEKAASGMAAVRAIQAAVDDMATGQSAPPVQLIKERLQRSAAWMAASGLFDEIIVVGKDGTLWIGKNGSSQSIRLDAPEISSALSKEELTTQLKRGLGLLTITSPLFSEGQCIAAVQVPIRIDRVLQSLCRSRQLIWLYIGLNALVLLIFGNFLLSRIVIRPIQRLVEMADDFKGTDLFSAVSATDGNEIARLTMSLNRMLKHLAENREALEAQIDSLKQAREEVLRSEKLSSIGRLAAGVAHEVGNPIGAILGYAGLLEAHVEENEEAKDYLVRIQREITRIDAIVRELLDFSRHSRGASFPVDINALVSESVSFFSHQKVMASVKVAVRLQEDLGVVWADPDQLKQVLINLMFNACDAMEGAGSLTLATSQIPSPEQRDKGPDEQPPEWIEISVSDTGKGIRASELNKIFDPFYTTKPPGKGTDLGLAICLRIVESFSGRISVDSVEGKGSTFKISLPLERRA